MDPDYIPPPPAYSEQEFDQKISQAIALSLHTSQASSTSTNLDGWSQYDLASTEGSSPSPTSAGRSSPCPIETFSGRKDDYKPPDRIGGLPSVVPLRIEKKNHSKSLPNPPAIPHSWNQSSSIISENSTPIVLSNCDDFGSQPHPVQSTHVEDDLMLLSTASPVQQSAQIAHKGDATPPPPFFEVQPPICLPDSRPLDSHYHHQHVDPYNATPSQFPRQSLPNQFRPRFVPQERPMSSYSPNNFQSSCVPRLDFNPSIAYGRTQSAAPSHPLRQPAKNVQYDPHSFYNSAVSAQITPVTTAEQYGHSSYSSYNSRNSFSPRPGHYSQSYVSQDPLWSERSSALSEVNRLQSPPSPSASSYSMSSNYQTLNISPSPVYQYVAHTTNVPGNIYYDQQSPGNRWSTQ